MKTFWILPLAGAVVLAAALLGCREEPVARPGGDDPVARGRYLVEAFACADCHTPQRPGPRGLEPDPDFAYGGHPADMVVPPAPVLEPGPWVGSFTGTLTAWSGPWGTSFAANLTPDPETGLGTWDADTFIRALRSGRHRGMGRPILPPMPAAVIAKLTDEDLRAVFAYLQSLPPIVNKVPEPRPPAGRP